MNANAGKQLVVIDIAVKKKKKCAIQFREILELIPI